MDHDVHNQRLVMKMAFKSLFLFFFTAYFCHARCGDVKLLCSSAEGDAVVGFRNDFKNMINDFSAVEADRKSAEFSRLSKRAPFCITLYSPVHEVVSQ